VRVLTAGPLEDLCRRVFEAHHVPAPVAAVVARSLVLGNLKGHDSHGVIRVIDYVDWLARGWIEPAGELEVIRDDGPILVTDGHFGFGQYVGRQATELAIERTRSLGICVLTLRRSGHLGRLGEFAEMAAEAGQVHFSFTNTHGAGVLVAPHGGCERRLSANPLAAGAPVPGEESLIMDMATSTVAEGKMKVWRARGERVPPGLFVTASGETSTDPSAFYADPPGALLPMAGHKGFALSVFAEVFAGALAGGSCSRPDERRVANGWFALFVAPERFCGRGFYESEIARFRDWVKSSRRMEGVDAILMPGEPEAHTEAVRSRDGISIDEDTWSRIEAIARRCGVL
jgi:hydroxycarboxylate dehydrogenase B